MKLEKSFITSEDHGKLDWVPNAAVMYSVVNKDKPNAYGEYPGWRIMPSKLLCLVLSPHLNTDECTDSGNMVHLTIQDSTDLGESANWVGHNLYALQRKDSEPRSTYVYNNLDTEHPVVDFNKFFDGESLEQEDLVL